MIQSMVCVNARLFIARAGKFATMQCLVKLVLSKHLKETLKLIASDRCLLNTGKFALI